MENYYMYVFVKEDLSHPQQIVQAAHAAAKIGEKYHGDTYIVLCGAKNEEHLDAISQHLERHSIDHELFFEPDIDGYTTIATAPLKGNERQPLRKFKLLQ